MKKFLALYMAPIESFDKAMQWSEEEMKKGMDEWTEWNNKNKGAIVDLGAPLGKTKRVSKKGVSDMRNTVGGYSIVQAESLTDAAKLFENHPHFGIESGWVEVMGLVDMPEM